MRLLARLARFALSWRGLLVLVVLVGLGFLAAWYLMPDDRGTRDWARHYDVSIGRPDLIPPGTVIGTGPPPGWSRLVVKSKPRLAPGERAHLWGLTAHGAELLFAAFLADVEPGPGPAHYRLAKVAIGMGVSVRGQDMVLSPETAESLKAGLSVIDREVLAESYRRQENAKLLIQAPAFGLVDAPVPFRCGARHHMVAFRYALLVDEPTGRLDVLAWWVDPERRCERTGPLTMNLLPPDLLNEPLLYADLQEINALGIPKTDTAFAVDRLPPAAAIYGPDADLAGLAERSQFSAEEAHRLESGLRALLAGPPVPNPKE